MPSIYENFKNLSGYSDALREPNMQVARAQGNYVPQIHQAVPTTSFDPTPNPRPNASANYE